MESGESYDVRIRKKYNKKADGAMIGPFYQEKQWQAAYDKNKKMLWIGVLGKGIYFDPQRKELKMGIEPYKKL